jgi:enoyl-CoA hydratase/carnithine racemase
MGDPPVRCQIERGVATITLDSPANRNALSTALIAGLHAALDQAEESDARVIVLTATPPVFCAGADLKERNAGSTNSAPAMGAGHMAHAMERLITCRQPTIAAVEGPVRAGGVGLMASCDLVVVRTDVTFAFTEVRIGVAPAIISVPILRRCPWSKVAAPFLTGEAFDAESARDMGLVTHVSDDVPATVGRLVEGILAGAPGAVAATKTLLHHAGHGSLVADLTEMRALSERLFASDEAAEGMTAFAERRAPIWTQER